MYGYNGGSHYGNFQSTYATAPAQAAAVANVYGAVPPPQQQGSVYGATTQYTYGMPASYPYTAAATQLAAASHAAQHVAAAAQVQAAQNAYAASSVARAAAAATVDPTYGGQFGFGAGSSAYAAHARNAAAAAAASAATTASAIANLTHKQSSSYDAAVYAAATSFLHAKTGAPAAPMQPPHADNRSFPKKTCGAAARPMKRYGNQNPDRPRDSQQYYCDTCKITCAGQATYKEHLEGQKHRKKLALEKEGSQVPLPKHKVSFRCDLCNVTCTGKDTYDAHMRGTKHTKAVQVCKKRGIAVPQNEPTVILPTEFGGSIPPPPNQPKVVGVATMNFVGAGKLTTLGEKEILEENRKQQVMAALSSAGQPVDDDVSSKMEAIMAAEEHVKPVGQEYIESKKDAQGRVSFRCKLCECEFTDPNAKEIHLKGRRHRLTYKQKVDPSLYVEMKANSLRAKREQRQMGGVRGGGGGEVATPGPGPAHHSAAFNRIPWFGPPSQPDPALFTVDDGLILEKLSRLIPSNQKMDAIERLTLVCEKALKSVSDFFAERDSTPHQDRALKGVLRVGSLACGVVMADDEMVEMVAMCKDRPSVALLNDIAQRMPKFLEIHRTTWDDQATPIVVRACEQEACIDVTCEVDCKITVRITLSSQVVREIAAVSGVAGGGGEEGKEAGLPLPPSLTALARLRRVNWFQVKCSGEAVLACVRLLADIRTRIETWQPLTEWHCCLLIERVVGCSPFPLGPSDSLRRIFEAIAGGLLYASGPGLADPCEKERVDVLADLTGQQREDMTCSAQHALRMLAFGQLWKILDLEVAPPPPACFMAPETRKRVYEGEGEDEEGVRKERKVEQEQELAHDVSEAAATEEEQKYDSFTAPICEAAEENAEEHDASTTPTGDAEEEKEEQDRVEQKPIV